LGYHPEQVVFVVLQHIRGSMGDLEIVKVNPVVRIIVVAEINKQVSRLFYVQRAERQLLLCERCSRSKLPTHVDQVIILIKQDIIQIRRRPAAPLVTARNKSADRCAHPVIDQSTLPSTAAYSTKCSGYHRDQGGERGAGSPEATCTLVIFPHLDVDRIPGYTFTLFDRPDLVSLVTINGFYHLPRIFLFTIILPI